MVCLPYATIEPIRSKLHASFQTERLEIDHAWVARLKERLLETPVEMLVRFGRAKLTGRQLTKLKVGDIILLNTDTDDLLPAEIEGVLKYHGICGTVKGNKAFQVIKEEEPKTA